MKQRKLISLEMRRVAEGANVVRDPNGAYERGYGSRGDVVVVRTRRTVRPRTSSGGHMNSRSHRASS